MNILRDIFFLNLVSSGQKFISLKKPKPPSVHWIVLTEDGAGIEAYQSFLDNVADLKKNGSLPVELN